MLQIENLTVSVLNKKILSDLTLTIKNGEIHAIMGPNGVGKSTICRVILKDPSYEIEKGRIIYNDKDIKNLSTTQIASQGLFLLNQFPPAIEGVTNAEMLRIALSEKKGEHIPIFDFNKKLEKICDELLLKTYIIHEIINLGASGGERKKIELLHMWILEPNFIILDELDSGLDVDALKIVINSLKKYYLEYKPAILIITHHQNVLQNFDIDYVHVLKNGKIIESGDKNLAQKIEKIGFSQFDEAFNIRKSEKNE